MTDRHIGWDTPTKEFDCQGHSLNVQHQGRLWRLRSAGASIETRDLSAGIDALFGKGRHNFDLVLQILEWDLDAARGLAG